MSEIQYLDYEGLLRYHELIDAQKADKTELNHTITIKSGKKSDGSTDISATSSSATSPTITLGVSGVTANGYGDTTDLTPSYSSTFKVPYIKVNALGIVVDASEHTVTIPASDNTDNTGIKLGTVSGTKKEDSTVIKTSSTTGLTIAGGTNKFSIGDGTNYIEVPITPSISNNVTGSGLTADTIILGNGDSAIKTSSKTITTTLGSDDTTIPTSKAVETAISNATAGLTGAMHFIGSSSTPITDGGTESPTISGYTGIAKTEGNVVLYGQKEFVWTGTVWEELGNEGSYALSTVKVEGTGVLGGGGTLTENRTITHNTSGVHSQDSAQTYGPNADVTGSDSTTIKVPQISVDKYGHITSVTERTYTSVNNTYTVNDATFSVKTKVGSNSAVTAADFTANQSTADDITFIQGDNITLTTDTTNRTITVEASMPVITYGSGSTLDSTKQIDSLFITT